MYSWPNLSQLNPALISSPATQTHTVYFTCFLCPARSLLWLACNEVATGTQAYPSSRIHCKSLRVKMEMRMLSTSTRTSVGISASMANAVKPEVANELTFRFTSAYLSIIIAFCSREGRRRERRIHPHPGRIETSRMQWTHSLLIDFTDTSRDFAPQF